MVLSSEAYYNTSFCCDDDSNLVFRNFTTTEFSYNWPGYEETSRWMHGAVESIGDLIFTSEVPQGIHLARLKLYFNAQAPVFSELGWGWLVVVCD